MIVGVGMLTSLNLPLPAALAASHLVCEEWVFPKEEAQLEAARRAVLQQRL